MSHKRIVAIGLVTAASLAVSGAVSAQTASLDTSVSLSGAGSSFMSNFIEQCKADVKKGLNINITYQPTGSGAGRSGFISGTTDFSGSDVAFSSSELPQVKDKFSYIPVTIGGIAIAYNVPGVAELKLSSPTLAKIFGGAITKWNDEAIAKENSGVTLPAQNIKVLVRSDSSGTSNVFTDYLSSTSKGAWTKGVTSTFPVPAGSGIAQRGSDGVTNYLNSPQGEFGITYSELSFATERKLGVAKVINTAGNAVKPDAANVTAAMSEAAINDDGTLLLNFNGNGKDDYPISTTSYLIVKQTMDPKKGDVMRAFLTYALGGCQDKAGAIGYAPLPKKLVDLGLKALATINPGSAPSPTIAGAGAPAGTTPAPATTAAPATTVAPATTAVKPTTTKKGKPKPKTPKKK
jgi:phosphate transport system substrate-binding protein